MRALVPATVVLSLALGAPGASAWAPETRMAIADEALRLMPESLRLALDMHRVDLMTGVLKPLAEEDSPDHRAPWNGGRLDDAIVREATGLDDALSVKTPFATLAERFGRLAHFVMDAGFPPGVADGDGGDRYAHFSRFCESRRPKFPVVFYGHDDPALDRGDWPGFAREVLDRARADDRTLARAYAAAGRPPAASAFDDRSIPFAIGSLAFSRSVNDVMRAWLAAWAEAGGDLGRTPFRTNKKESP